MKEEGNKKMHTPRQKVIHNPISTFLCFNLLLVMTCGATTIVPEAFALLLGAERGTAWSVSASTPAETIGRDVEADTVLLPVAQLCVQEVGMGFCLGFVPFLLCDIPFH